MNVTIADKKKSPEFKNNFKKSKATSERRKSLRPLAMELKIDSKWLNKKFDETKTNKNMLNALFYEGKLLYNYCIYMMDQDKDIFDSKDFDYKNKNILKSKFDEEKSTYKNKVYIYEPYTLQYLSAGLRIMVFESIKNSIKALSELKKKGEKVGRLRYVFDFNSLSFRSTDILGKRSDWWTKTDGGIVIKKGYGTYMPIPIFKNIKVIGVKQIPEGVEIRDYKLVRKGKKYYIMLNTCFPYDEVKGEGAVGIDMGIRTTVTTSDGDKYKAEISESKRLKNIARRMANIQLTNKNWRKSKHYFILKLKLNDEYRKINNKKNEYSNQLMNELKTKYETIIIQDENLKAWKTKRKKNGKKKRGFKFTKQVQYSVLGRIKAKVKILEKRKRGIIIDRFEPTTKNCPKCFNVTNIKLEDKIFECSACGYTEDRDIKAAKTILGIGLGLIKFPKKEKQDSNSSLKEFPLTQSKQENVIG